MKHINFIKLLIILLTASPVVFAVSDRTISYFPDFNNGCYPTKMQFKEFLYRIAFRNDVKFTIEQAYDSTQPGNFLFNEVVKVDVLSNETVSQIMNAMSIQLNNKFVWDFNVQNPKIIHIIDRRLLDKKEYVMTMTIDSIDYSGNTGGLLELLHEKYHRLIPKSNLTFWIGANDTWSSAEIKIKGASLRDILARSVQYEGYSTVVWESKTDVSTMETVIGFSGPAPRK